MKLKYIFITTIILTSRLVSQETNVEIEDKPLYLEFYEPQKIIDKPSIEYDYIELPYEQYISPEIKKNYVINKIYSIQPSLNIRTTTLIGEKNSRQSLQINNLLPSKVLDFNFLSTIQKLEESFLQNYNFTKLGLNYNEILKNYILGFDINFYDHNYRYNLQQYDIDFLFIKNFSQKINFVYDPEIFFVQNDKQNFNYYLVNNGLSINYIPTYNLFFGISFVPFYYNDYYINYYVIKLLIKNFLWYNTNAKINFSIDNKTDNIYYEIGFTKNYNILSVEIAKNKRYYYEYIKEYFVKYPDIKFNNYKFEILDMQDSFIKTTFGSEKNNIFIKYNIISYNHFPTYIFTNNTLNTLYKKDVKYDLILYGLNFDNDNLFLGYSTELVSNSEKILFVPQQKQEIKLGIKNKKVKFSNTFVINDTLPINDNNDYLANNIILTTELEFFLNDEIIFNIFYNTTIVGKNYLQPGTYLSSNNILFGIKLNF